MTKNFCAILLTIIFAITPFTLTACSKERIPKEIKIVESYAHKISKDTFVAVAEVANVADYDIKVYFVCEMLFNGEVVDKAYSPTSTIKVGKVSTLHCLFKYKSILSLMVYEFNVIKWHVYKV